MVHDDWVVFFKSHLAGWLITIFAISLGAPFWFDVLGRVAQAAGAGQKPNESPPGRPEVTLDLAQNPHPAAMRSASMQSDQSTMVPASTETLAVEQRGVGVRLVVEPTAKQRCRRGHVAVAREVQPGVRRLSGGSRGGTGRLRNATQRQRHPRLSPAGRRAVPRISAGSNAQCDAHQPAGHRRTTPRRLRPDHGSGRPAPARCRCGVRRPGDLHRHLRRGRHPGGCLEPVPIGSGARSGPAPGPHNVVE